MKRTTTNGLPSGSRAVQNAQAAKFAEQVRESQGKSTMTTTLNIPLWIELEVVVHEIEGGGFWGEVPRFPGCLAQAETREELHAQILQAFQDWMAQVPEKTEEEARQLAEIQGSGELADKSYPQPYNYLPSSSWKEEDE